MRQSIEKHQFNISIAVAVSLIVFLVWLTINITKRQTNMESRVDKNDETITHVWDKYIWMRNEIEEMKKNDQWKEIQLAEMNIKLANIELMVMEIKEKLK